MMDEGDDLSIVSPADCESELIYGSSLILTCVSAAHCTQKRCLRSG